MYSVATLASLSLVAANLTFDEFVVKHSKTYNSEVEAIYRRGVFDANVAQANKENEQLRAIGEDAVHGVTKFMDLTSTEFKAKYLNYKYVESNATRVEFSAPNAAPTMDWREKGAITPIKQQGECGSCWAFSAVSAIESYSHLNGGKLIKLSAQQVTSCDMSSYGCGGGHTEDAYAYVKQHGGLELDSDYPYTDQGCDDSSSCTSSCKANYAKTQSSTRVTGYTGVKAGESNLLGALQGGPPSICLDADAFQTYKGGVISSCPGGGRVDHCVQAVGYTSSYWIVRNQWGTGWGDNGYVYIKRGSNVCDISNDVTIPTF